MDGHDVRRDKSKAFKVTADTLERVNRLIKQTGKGDTEFFEELVYDLEVNRLTSDDNEEIPADLRRSFQQDVQKLKNATNSILALFTSQMENVAVEKDRWMLSTQKQVTQREEKLEEQTAKFNELKTRFDTLNEELANLTEINVSIQKERDSLLKQIESQDKLAIARDEKIGDFSERINRLNETIVAKEEELQKAAPLREENQSLHESIGDLKRQLGALELTRETEVAALNQDMVNLKQEQEAERIRQAETLRFEFEKEKLELQKQAAAAQEEVRTEAREKAESITRAFYTKEIERLQASWAQEEDDYRAQIEDLREQVRQTQKPTDSKTVE